MGLAPGRGRATRPRAPSRRRRPPVRDPSAGWWDYVDAVVEAIDERRELVVVGHSLGGFTAPLVCARMPVDLLVLVAAMIPSPGELFDDWWASSGYEASGYDDVFYHDVPPDLAAEARRREREEAARALREPWPLAAWPEPRRRPTSSAAMTGCSRRRGRDATRASGSASSPRRWTAATTSRSADRGSWPTGSPRTQRKLGEPRQFPARHCDHAPVICAGHIARPAPAASRATRRAQVETGWASLVKGVRLGQRQGTRLGRKWSARLSIQVGRRGAADPA